MCYNKDMENDKIVIFDWGGIAIDLENHAEKYREATLKTLRALGCKLSDEEIDVKWRKHRETSDINAIADVEELKSWLLSCGEDLGFDADYDNFTTIFENNVLEIVPRHKEVADYAGSLKNRCKNGILSNLAIFHKNIISQYYNFEDFDKIYLSYELGMSKPDHRIYQYIEKDLGLPPDKILFIDDDEKNIIGAHECGWRVCHATGHELDKIKSSVEDFLA